jgi:hypothetical protein
MRKAFSRNFTSKTSRERAPDTGYWVKGSRGKLQSQNPQAGIDFNHPVVADPAQPNTTGKLDLKWQATSGTGDPSNPSKPVTNNNNMTGQPKPQNMVTPKVPVELDPADLRAISGSETFLDNHSTKHNIHAGGGNRRIIQTKINTFHQDRLVNVYLINY